MPKFVGAGLLLLLYLYGGSYALTTPAGVILLGLALAGVTGRLVWLLIRPSIRSATQDAARPSAPLPPRSPAPLLPAFYLLAVSLLSAALHPPTLEALTRLALLWLAVALLVILDDVPLDGSLRLVGWLWPLVWWWWPENPNIGSVWPLVFVLFGLFGNGGSAGPGRRCYQTGRLGDWEVGRLRDWETLLRASAPLLLCLIHGAILLYLGSRGALIGLAAAVTWPVVSRFRPPNPPAGGISAPPFGGLGGLAFYGLGLAVLAGALYWLRPVTAGYRLHYWRAALEAWATAPWLGIGPGQLWAGQWISSYPGSELFMVHAHNALVATLAETGLIGLAALLWLVYSLFTIHCSLFTRSALIALAVWSLVDEPLWWPGPLILSVLIIRSRK